MDKPCGFGTTAGPVVLLTEQSLPRMFTFKVTGTSTSMGIVTHADRRGRSRSVGFEDSSSRESMGFQWALSEASD